MFSLPRTVLALPKDLLVRGLATVSRNTVIPKSTTPLLEDIPTSSVLSSRQYLPLFSISREKGFLPRDDPIVSLPAVFAPLETLLSNMTIRQPDGSDGLLACGTFGDTVQSELRTLAVLAEAVADVVVHGQTFSLDYQNLVSALFRDYSFLTSAYLLEPVDSHYRKTGLYASGRPVLPREIAVPMKMLADSLGHFPFMEYASSYALTNWTRKDQSKGMDFDNLRVIRAFEDPDGSEAGFILVHVEMVSHSGKLVSAAENALSAAEQKDRANFNAGLEGMWTAYKKINAVMETMWTRSKPSDYLKFRSFIFGTAPGPRLNAMFPEGVLYEGVSDAPMFFRGESGANDSMIPLGDNVLEITAQLPDNELKKTLREFRQYRPPAQRLYVEVVEQRATAAGARAFAAEDASSLARYALVADQIRDFRDRHWRFTKEYIIKRTPFKLATGGSPILQYLPQNLSTVLVILDEAVTALGHAGIRAACAPGSDMATRLLELEKIVGVQKRVLAREVKWLNDRAAAASGDRPNTMAMDGMDGSKVYGAQELKWGEEKPLKRGWVGNDGVG